MWTDPNINSAMGLQATAATKRKHDITFDSKDANTYTNCPPPVKTSRWSTTTTIPTINNNNNTSSNNYKNETTTTVAPTTIIMGNSSSTNSAAPAIVLASAAAGNLIKNSATCDENKVFNSAPSALMTAATSNGNPVTITTTNCATSSSSSSEDSIAKLEVVAAVPCEPWHTSEPVDCISKLQAVAVPSDPWGSISTRSTLATTLLSTDEMDDDDDDFEDDYEEEESIIPTYCPLRYHPCPPASSGTGGGAAAGNPGAGGNPAAMQRNYSPANGYNTRPNYYSEPFPQQNCSRTGNQHLRMAPNAGFAPQWGNSAGQNGFYVPPEAAYPPPQQTIRCAENGKSYLELGCSPTSFSSLSNQSGVGMVAGNSNGMDARHPLKRCCDGRAGTWCNTNKNCYKDVRLKIRNLSMFKLSRFRQVSEQSLYRSVLICNTLKYIDREIESEAKEMHQQQQQHHLNHPHHPHQSHLHHHVPHHGSSHHHHHHNSHHHHHQQQQQQHLQHQQSLQHQQQSNNANGDYSPVMGCARVTSLDYHQMQQQQQHQQQHNQFHSQQQPADSRNGDCTQQSPYMNTMSKSGLFNNQPQQHPHQQHPQQQHHQHLQHPHCNSGDSLHPYDHYPFRESQSGRATPFPAIPSPVVPTPVIPVPSTTTSSDTDSGYGEDDSNRSINWSSVLSLSSQSALDPLNNNDLFTILPPATSSTSPPAATPVSLNSSAVSISGTFTASSVQSNNNSGSLSTSSSLTSPLSSSTPTTFTTLSTISSSTYSLTSSSASSFAAAAAASTWEYGFLDMDFGLGSEFTELVPSCKLSSDDLFKSVSPVSALSASRYSSVHDNELEQPAHIMVGS